MPSDAPFQAPHLSWVPICFAAGCCHVVLNDGDLCSRHAPDFASSLVRPFTPKHAADCEDSDCDRGCMDDPAVAARIAADALLRETTAERDALRADRTAAADLFCALLALRATDDASRAAFAQHGIDAALDAYELAVDATHDPEATARASRVAAALDALGARRGEG